MTKVYIMRGASGAGKSTWVRQHLPGARVFSADTYFTVDGVYQFNPALLPLNHNLCLLAFLGALQSGDGGRVIGTPLVVDNTNTKTFEIAPYYRLAEALGHEVEVVWLVAPADVCKARTTHGTPPAAIDAMVQGVEPLPPWWNVRVVVG